MKGVLVGIVLVVSSASEIIHAPATRTTTRTTTPTESLPIQILGADCAEWSSQTAGAGGAYCTPAPKCSCDELNMLLAPNAATSATVGKMGKRRCLSKPCLQNLTRDVEHAMC